MRFLDPTVNAYDEEKCGKKLKDVLMLKHFEHTIKEQRTTITT